MLKKNPTVVYIVVKVLDYLRFCNPIRHNMIKDIEKLVDSIMQDLQVSGHLFF